MRFSLSQIVVAIGELSLRLELKNSCSSASLALILVAESMSIIFSNKPNDYNSRQA